MTTLAARLRHHARRGRRLLRELAPLERTALRIPDGQQSPDPNRFAAYGRDSWIVPPARVFNPERMAVGDEVVVMEGSTLAVVAPGTAAGTVAGTTGGPLLVLGDRVRTARFWTIVCEVGITIGDDVSGSDGVVIVDTWRQPIALDRQPPFPPPPPAPVRIGRGAYLGMSCCIGPGVTIGEGAYVAEGAVVLEDVPDHAVAIGNPASVRRQHDPASGSWEGRPWP